MPKDRSQKIQCPQCPPDAKPITLRHIARHNKTFHRPAGVPAPAKVDQSYRKDKIQCARCPPTARPISLAHMARHNKTAHPPADSVPVPRVPCSHAGCKLDFSSAEAMRLHVSMKHTDGYEKPFACRHPDCTTRWHSQPSMELHYTRAHTVRVAAKCADCEREFVDETALAAHLARAEETAYISDLAMHIVNAVNIPRSEARVLVQQARDRSGDYCVYCNVPVAFTSSCAIAKAQREGAIIEQASKERLYSHRAYNDPKQVLLISCIVCNIVKSRMRHTVVLPFFRTIAQNEPVQHDYSPVTSAERKHIRGAHTNHAIVDDGKPMLVGTTASLEEYVELARQSGRVCAVTGLRGVFSSNSPAKLSADRIANTIGGAPTAHSVDNVRFTHAWVNSFLGMTFGVDAAARIGRYVSHLRTGAFEAATAWTSPDFVE
ncbi:hypothetical protein HDU86_006896 [Geranomyces michiganensis]|nr:hypothetical protein HDU86_006896 [Geranomyces michiganensis]